MVTGNVRTVTFKGNQGAEDLYLCKETGKIYVRQPCDKENVRWCTTSKWSGGYEADCPLKEGLEMHIVDQKGVLLYQETMVKDEFYGTAVAVKAAPFSYDATKELAKKVQQDLNLASYKDWTVWLMAEAEKANFHGERDNWLYAAAIYSEIQKVEKLSILGEELYLTTQRREHRVCGKVWTCYEIYSKDLVQCEAICGYVLDAHS